MHRARVKGTPVPPSILAEMKDSAPLLRDPAALCARLESDGYLLLRGVLDVSVVSAARAEVLKRLEKVGEILPDTDGIFTGTSSRRMLEPDLGTFWKSVSEGMQLRAATHSAEITNIMSVVLGQSVRAQDYVFLRVGVNGRGTGLHYDYPFFARAHDQVRTVWVPLGDVAVEQGPLVIVEGSHHFTDLIDEMRGFDVSEDTTRKADLGTDAISFAISRGTRLLTTNFAAGDLALFGMYTAHGSLDHCDASGRVRVSCDVRWQAKSMPADDRYFGINPRGTTGIGYGELNGAKPLDQPWHMR